MTGKLKTHIYVNQPNLVQISNKYMGQIDKADNRWYIVSSLVHLYLGSYLVIPLVNAWFLYRRNFKILSPNAKFVSLKRFQAEVATSLIAVERHKASRSSLDATPPAKKRASAIRINPTHDM